MIKKTGLGELNNSLKVSSKTPTSVKGTSFSELMQQVVQKDSSQVLDKGQVLDKLVRQVLENPKNPYSQLKKEAREEMIANVSRVLTEAPLPFSDKTLKDGLTPQAKGVAEDNSQQKQGSTHRV